jgi:hypothetical protein
LLDPRPITNRRVFGRAVDDGVLHCYRGHDGVMVDFQSG